LLNRRGDVDETYLDDNTIHDDELAMDGMIDSWTNHQMNGDKNTRLSAEQHREIYDKVIAELAEEEAARGESKG
jgi:hypothetical protein